MARSLPPLTRRRTPVREQQSLKSDYPAPVEHPCSVPHYSSRAQRPIEVLHVEILVTEVQPTGHPSEKWYQDSQGRSHLDFVRHLAWAILDAHAADIPALAQYGVTRDIINDLGDRFGSIAEEWMAYHYPSEPK